jgi:hypothetical protein
MPLLTGMRASVLASDLRIVDHALEQHGSVFANRYGDRCHTLYDRAGWLIASWGMALRKDEARLPAGWARRVNQ